LGETCTVFAISFAKTPGALNTRFLRYIFTVILLGCLQAVNCFGQSPVFAKLTGNLASSMTAGDQHKAVLGFKVTVPSGNSITFSQFTFGCSPGTSNAFLANGTLYRFPSGTTSYSTTGGVPVGNVTFNGGTITISDLAETISGSSYSYFLVADAVNTSASYFQLVVSYGNTFAIDNNNNTYPAHYSDNEGYSYASGTPYAIKVASASKGLSSTSTALVSTSTDVALFGFNLASSSGTKNISQIYINSNLGTVSNYFSNFRLYTTSTSDTFTSTTLATPVAGTFTVVGQGSFVKFVPTTAIAASTSLKYYWLVADVSLTGTLPVFPQFSFAYGQSQNAFSVSSNNYNNFTVNGPTYNINYAGVTVTKLTGGLTSGTITAAQTDIAAFGFDVTANGSVSISEVNINSNGAGTYFNNPQLYWTNSTTYSAATRHLVATGTFVGNYAHFSGITTETITNDTKHYFLVVDNIGADASNPTIAFNFTNGQTSSAIVQTSPAASTYNNFNITGNNYTIPSPTIVVTGLNTVSNNITTSISPGLTKVAVFGFKVKAIGALTVNEFNFDFPAGSNGTYFSNAKLYYSSDDVYSAGDASIGSVDLNSSYAHIGSLGLSLNNETRNYFLVVDVNTFNNASSPASVYFRFDHTQSHSALILDPYKTLNTYDITGATLNFPANTTYIWTGNANNTDFTNSSNWSKFSGYPGSTSDVVIPGGCTYYPNITATGTIISSLTFSGTAPNITIASGKSLQINSGLILAAGTTPTITGAVTLSSGSVSTISSTAVLTLGASTTITNSGTLTLQSDATSSASIANIPSTSSIIGNVNVERWITGGAGTTYRGYRLLSSPVNISNSTTGNIDLGYINNTNNMNALGALTGGPGGTDKGFSVAIATPAIYLYREDVAPVSGGTNAGKNKGITAIYSAGTASSVDVATGTNLATISNFHVPVGNGYIFYNIGSTAQPGNATVAGAPASYAITAKGYLNQGTILFKNWYTSASTLSYTDALPSNKGFNMIGNPYACTLNLNTFYNDNSSAIQPNIFVLNNINPGQAYISYNAATGIASDPHASQYIASGQGMFVQARSASALTFKESQKASTQQLTGTQLLMGKPVKEAAISGFYMKLEQDSLINDYCGIYFDGDSDDFDINDAVDLDGASPKVYMSSYTADGRRTGINALSDYKDGKIIKLYVNATTNGLYKLKIEQIKNIDAIYDIWLKDNYKNDSLDLRSNDTYNFNIIRSDAASIGASRFEIVIRKKSLPKYQFVSLTGKATTMGVSLTWKTHNEYNFTGFTVERLNAGKQYDPLNYLQSDGAGTYTFIDKNPSMGINTYRIKQDDIDNNISYSSDVSVDTSKPNSKPDNITVFPSPATALINIKFTSPLVGPVNAMVVNAMGDVVNNQIFTQQQSSMDVSKLKTGVYFIRCIDVSTQKEIGMQRFVKL
jgi:hypothetical protein